TAQGGGLYATNGTLSLTNDTVAWNYINLFEDRGALATPGGQGGGVYSNGSANTLNLKNTIIALDLIFTNSQKGENNADGTYDNLAGTAAPQNGDNLIGGVNGVNDSDLVPAIGTQPAGSQQLFAVPVTTKSVETASGSIASLSGQVPGNYVGLTYTLPLAWNTSPAIDAGNVNAAGLPSTDQRGLPRVVNGTIDIGATETQITLTGSPSVSTV